jgi:hypothetical protein
VKIIHDWQLCVAIIVTNQKKNYELVVVVGALQAAPAVAVAVAMVVMIMISVLGDHCT